MKKESADMTLVFVTVSFQGGRCSNYKYGYTAIKSGSIH